MILNDVVTIHTVDSSIYDTVGIWHGDAIPDEGEKNKDELMTALSNDPNGCLIGRSALIEKGLSRQEAYELVQRNAMKSWKGNKNFLALLKADSEVTASLPPAELETLFDYQYYLRYIDEIFQRLGLTEAQWKEKPGRVEPGELAPRKI